MQKTKKKPEEVKILPHVIRRKKIYKGKVAKTGTLYIELTVTDGRRKYQIAKLIEGGQGEKAEGIIVTIMYQTLRKKYFPND